MANIATDLHKDEYKVIIIGALAVGKTSLLLRYVHNTFEDRISKFISEEKKSVVVNGREIVLHLWDTAGMLCNMQGKPIVAVILFPIQYSY